MKPILITILLLAIFALFLYAATLDGIIAFADNKCEFCEYLEEHDLEADTALYPANTIASMKSIDYELVLYDHMVFGHDRVARHVLLYNIPLNHCPQCGRIIR